MVSLTTASVGGAFAAIILYLVVLWRKMAGTRWEYAVADMPAKICGVTYAPFRAGQAPGTGRDPTQAQMREDLEILSTIATAVRTYSVTAPQDQIPALAAQTGLTVTLGVWISNDEQRNRAEIDAAIELAATCSNINAILIGNEVLLRNDISVQQLLAYIDEVRQKVSVPVSTSEPWDAWLNYPQLVDHVDFIAAHFLPFWLNIWASDALAFIVEHTDELQHRFPGKPLVLTEVGWPSKGRIPGGAIGKRSDQAIFIRQLTRILGDKGLDYFIIEAFDQPWKTAEGKVGPHWGIFDSARRPKFPLHGPLGFAHSWRHVLKRCLDLSVLNWAGWLAVISALMALTMVAAWTGWHLSQPTPPWLTPGLAVFGSIGWMLAIIAEFHEVLECLWQQHQHRLFVPIRNPSSHRPTVSIHVPIHNEPAPLVNATLSRLAALDYSNFEVLVIDNNTANLADWLPVSQHCENLGPRFRFFHVAPLSGYKSGALNYALDRTCEAASLVAVIDADYCVSPNWLKHLTPIFETADIAVVQAPQDYHDGFSSVFKQFCYWEYQSFFSVGMVIRNHHDAIIEHGTMTLIRKSVLQSLRWAHWSICEDAELGLRVLEKGYSTAYVKRSYGWGTMPDSFLSFKNQRFRWAYGAVQIIKRHSSFLFSASGSRLTWAQRYHFLAGWAPWAARGLGLIKNVGFAAWAIAILCAPTQMLAPPVIVTVPLLLLFSTRCIKLLWLYRQVMGIDFRAACASTLAGMALYPTIGKAVLYATVNSRFGFHRTPKSATEKASLTVWAQARQELGVGLALLVLAAATVLRDAGVTHVLWSLLLIMESVPYWAAVAMALLAGKDPIAPHQAGAISHWSLGDEMMVTPFNDDLPANDRTPSPPHSGS